MSYTYSPELKAPQKMPEIDPGKPAMAGMLRILRLTHQKQTGAFQPPPGLKCHTIPIPSGAENDIPCFVIEPENAASVLPAVLMIHGGGFYLPVQISTLNLACEYAMHLNARVFVPEYRLVPQFTAPTQLEDCMAVWEFLLAQGQQQSIDTERMLLIGDSAGAALAAGLSIALRGSDSPQPKGQLLIYPVLDDRAERYASYKLNEDACWSPKSTKAMWDAYLKDADVTMFCKLIPSRCDDLHGLPKAYIEAQEIDVLRDEAVAFSEALVEVGVPTELKIVEGSYHGFDGDLSSPLVQQVIAHRIETAKKMLAL